MYQTFTETLKRKTLCIIQARMGSTRLPNKVLLPVGGKPLLEYEIRRVQQAKRLDRIVVATTTAPADDAIEELAGRLGVGCFRGPEDDVLERYRQCARQYPDFEHIVRVTGDCPLIDPALIDEVVTFFEAGGFEYASNLEPPTFPDGMDVEVFTRELLERASQEATLASEREHVTAYMTKDALVKRGSVRAPQDWSHIRLTVDQPEDVEVVEFLITRLPETAHYLDYVALLTKHPEIMQKNAHVIRNEGWLKSLREDRVVKKQ